MKLELLSLINCPECQNNLQNYKGEALRCGNCGYVVKVVDGIPLFTDVPSTIEPWQKVDRGSDLGTAWRRSNWKFLQNLVTDLPADAKILDVGAGHGDFADIFKGRNYYALDIVPYPEVDVVADLGKINPFKDNSFDMVVMMNVLEHVYESRELLNSIAKIVAPGGSIVIAVPFLLKVHQAPFDFSRFTPYFLEKMAAEAGLYVASLQGYFDTQYLLNESLGNVWQYSISSQPRNKQVTAKMLVYIIQKLINLLACVTQKGFIDEYKSQQNPAPVGYLVILRK
ncbi:MAG: type 11 methyltransferase [Chloroflexi bacterium]|nr:MAG: type 11 methyltransferase [Chloroflexota bacterium]